MSPAIGALRARLTLEAPQRTPDGEGGAEIAWVPVADVWAHVRALTGQEVPGADRLEARQSYEIVIRHRADVTPRARFRDDTRTFDIEAAADPDGRGRWLVCRCHETPNN